VPAPLRRTSATGGNNLAVGAVVDANSFYGTGTTTWNLNSSDNLIGFRFRNEANSQIHYGWARISLSGTLQGQPRSLVEYAYEDQPGVAISVGAIPAPGTLALLGLGAAGLVSRRRK
jgi:PEP-CTERM motif